MSASTSRILVVDDEEDVRAYLRTLLEREGYDVLLAANGSAALEMALDRAPDVVVTDILMPLMDGLELCRRLRESEEHRLTPVVMVTGLRDHQDRIRGIEAGADDFLSKPVEPAELLARVRSLLRMKRYTDELERAETVLFTLARAIEGRDPFTEGHCRRLSRLGAELGRCLGLDEADVVALERGGIVHDVGKVAVPDSVLLKPSELNEEEWALMHRHPVVGERICGDMRSFSPLLPIIRHHHEKLDGSGYPDGLAGDRIPYLARVMQVVDVWDALTNRRPYREALSPERAMRTLLEETEKGWWDEEVVTVFREMVEGEAA